jgi:hypothetical protein
VGRHRGAGSSEVVATDLGSDLKPYSPPDRAGGLTKVPSRLFPLPSSFLGQKGTQDGYSEDGRGTSERIRASA